MRRLILTLAALVAVSAGLLVAVPQQAEAANRYPICIQSNSSRLDYKVHAAAVSWDTRKINMVMRVGQNCTGRQALEIQVNEVRWGRNGTLGRTSAYRRSDGYPWFCRVYVNTSYADSGTRRYQRTIAHEIGHCLQKSTHRAQHWDWGTIMNIHRYSVYPTSWDRVKYLERWWGSYGRYGR